MDIFQEALYEICRLWESNRISVADEHLGTAITQYVMSNLYQHLEISDERRGKFVVTGVQGELHQVGANMVADVLEADGWDTVFLGTNVPEEGIIQAIRQHRADLFGISATMLFNIPKVIGLVEEVRSEYGNSVHIMWRKRLQEPGCTAQRACRMHCCPEFRRGPRPDAQGRPPVTR